LVFKRKTMKLNKNARNRLWIFILGSTLVLAGLFGPLVFTFWSEFRCYRPFQTIADVRSARDSFPNLVEANWQSQGHKVRGWFVAGPKMGTVILLHGSGGTREALLAEFAILSEAGFGVLAFDWPGHGESDGQANWGISERLALRGALEWLERRSDVDMQRVGAFGFSMGALPLLQEAVVERRLSAIAVAGAFSDVSEHLRWEYRKWGPIGPWGAVLAAWLRGTPVNVDSPRDIIGKLSPRPILVVVGEADRVVPPEMTISLYAVASMPKQLLLLSNVGHGEYSRASSAYSSGLAKFFEQSLARRAFGGK
jgi:pimeloyl-ACP methyl ester carboxylesterase